MSWHIWAINLKKENAYQDWLSHTTNMQQTTVKTFTQDQANLYKWRYIYYKKVENIVAKGELARFVQFILLSYCFQKSFAVDASKSVYKWERVNWSSYTVSQLYHGDHWPVHLTCVSRLSIAGVPHSTLTRPHAFPQRLLSPFVREEWR